MTRMRARMDIDKHASAIANEPVRRLLKIHGLCDAAAKLADEFLRQMGKACVSSYIGDGRCVDPEGGRSPGPTTRVLMPYNECSWKSITAASIPTVVKLLEDRSRLGG